MSKPTTARQTKPFRRNAGNTRVFREKQVDKNGVLAYHLVQSFKDFETTPEVAHKCGLELVGAFVCG